METNCMYCGKTVFYKFKSWERKFCSRKCYWLAKKKKRAKIVCDECGSVFEARYSEIAKSLRRGHTVRFCSDECHRKNFKNNKKTRKEICDRYVKKNGEKVKESKGKHHSKKHFGGNREVALKRDKYTCRECGRKDKLVVHHIDMNKKNNNLNNFMTLCSSCHCKLHSKLRGGDAL